MLELSVDGVKGEYGVLTDVGVPVFETGAAGWNERLEELSVLREFGEESKSCSTDVLVRMLLEEDQLTLGG